MADPRYDAEHKALREQWRPLVEAGLVECHAIVCLFGDRRIYPGQEWHLGHNPTATEHTGPEHVRCNCSEGGTRGAEARWDRPVPASMDW